VPSLERGLATDPYLFKYLLVIIAPHCTQILMYQLARNGSCYVILPSVVLCYIAPPPPASPELASSCLPSLVRSCLLANYLL
jgi:hypothetical protein